MNYELRFKPKAVKDLAGLPSREQERLLQRIEEMSADLKGDVRRLTNFTPEFRLRVGASGIGANRTDKGETEMPTIHAQIIKKDGKKEYAVLPYTEFVKIQEDLDDYENLKFLREAKDAEKDSPAIGLRELKGKLRQRAPRVK